MKTADNMTPTTDSANFLLMIVAVA